ncbi:unnamed protein product [Pleuronectes platessa]|uniref:Uncharacterized protein n=1 Tax=Pleuronectes platessa TaxID=8262 RepID=A0A9N7VRD6_PLEPL|nr:unnamed protein product [Pleuronectes platessa]
MDFISSYTHIWRSVHQMTSFRREFTSLCCHTVAPSASNRVPLFSGDVWAAPSIPGRPSANTHPPSPASCTVHSSSTRRRMCYICCMIAGCVCMKRTKV